MKDPHDRQTVDIEEGIRRVALGQLLVDAANGGTVPPVWREAIPQALAWLEQVQPRPYRVLSLRYGFSGPPHTYAAVGDAMGVSAQRAGQLAKRGMAFLRHHLYAAEQATGRRSGPIRLPGSRRI